MVVSQHSLNRVLRDGHVFNPVLFAYISKDVSKMDGYAADEANAMVLDDFLGIKHDVPLDESVKPVTDYGRNLGSADVLGGETGEVRQIRIGARL